MLEQDFKDIINNIKNEINTTQIMVMSDANKLLMKINFLKNYFVVTFATAVAKVTAS